MSKGDGWIVSKDFAEGTRLKSFFKKYPKEFGACFENLSRVVQALIDFGQPGAFQFGFFRSEGNNVWRIGQTGIGHSHETRLYVYLFVRGKTVYVLTIGDKSQQRQDIKRCKDLAKVIEQRSEHEDHK